MQNSAKIRFQRKARSLIPAMVILIAISVCHPTSLNALERVDNLNPTALLFAVEPVTAANHSQRRLSLRVQLQTASHALSVSGADESLQLDGETSKFSLIAALQLGDKWVLSTELPYLWHERGTLDNFINNWHQLFGLPQGVRDQQANNQLNLLYTRAGENVFAVTQSARGFGDARLSLQYSLDQWAPSLHIVGTLGLATGNAKKLTGSGANNASLALTWRTPSGAASPWQFSAAIGAAHLDRSDLFASFQKRALWFASAGADYHFNDAFSLGANVQARSSAVRSQLDEISGNSLMLITGGRWQFAKNYALDISVSEDLSVGHAPDVTFNVAIFRSH